MLKAASTIMNRFSDNFAVDHARARHYGPVTTILSWTWWRLPCGSRHNRANVDSSERGPVGEEPVVLTGVEGFAGEPTAQPWASAGISHETVPPVPCGAELGPAMQM